MIFTEQDGDYIKSKIKQYLSHDQLKALYYNALRLDVLSDDNNGKVAEVQKLLGPSFKELGPGTNRVAFLRDGYVFKIALDIDGMIDNFTEFKRGAELPFYLAKPYECNQLILVSEYVTVIDQEEFVNNIESIKIILEDMSANYIFDDMGTINKNFQNWGYRTDGTLVCLDYGYLYPKVGNEEALKCPKCGEQLEYTSTYAEFRCSKATCNAKYRIMDIRRRMNRKFEENEEEMIGAITSLKLPKLQNLQGKLNRV